MKLSHISSLVSIRGILISDVKNDLSCDRNIEAFEYFADLIYIKRAERDVRDIFLQVAKFRIELNKINNSHTHVEKSE